jgi:hypothetical protein
VLAVYQSHYTPTILVLRGVAHLGRAHVWYS